MFDQFSKYCWDFTIFLVEKKHDSPYKNCLNQYSYLIATETNREIPLKFEISEVYLQNHVKSLDFKKTLQTWSNIKNTVRIKTSWLLLPKMYCWIFLLMILIAKLKDLQILNQTQTQSHLRPCTQQSKKLTEAQLILFWFINVV